MNSANSGLWNSSSGKRKTYVLLSNIPNSITDGASGTSGWKVGNGFFYKLIKRQMAGGLLGCLISEELTPDDHAVDGAEPGTKLGLAIFESPTAALASCREYVSLRGYDTRVTVAEGVSTKEMMREYKIGMKVIMMPSEEEETGPREDPLDSETVTVFDKLSIPYKSVAERELTPLGEKQNPEKTTDCGRIFYKRELATTRGLEFLCRAQKPFMNRKVTLCPRTKDGRDCSFGASCKFIHIKEFQRTVKRDRLAEISDAATADKDRKRWNYTILNDMAPAIFEGVRVSQEGRDEVLKSAFWDLLNNPRDADVTPSVPEMLPLVLDTLEITEQEARALILALDGCKNTVSRAGISFQGGQNELPWLEDTPIFAKLLSKFEIVLERVTSQWRNRCTDMFLPSLFLKLDTGAENNTLYSFLTSSNQIKDYCSGLNIISTFASVPKNGVPTPPERDAFIADLFMRMHIASAMLGDVLGIQENGAVDANYTPGERALYAHSPSVLLASFFLSPSVIRNIRTHFTEEELSNNLSTNTSIFLLLQAHYAIQNSIIDEYSYFITKTGISSGGHYHGASGESSKKSMGTECVAAHFDTVMAPHNSVEIASSVKNLIQSYRLEYELERPENLKAVKQNPKSIAHLEHIIYSDILRAAFLGFGVGSSSEQIVPTPLADALSRRCSAVCHTLENWTESGNLTLSGDQRYCVDVAFISGLFGHYTSTRTPGEPALRCRQFPLLQVPSLHEVLPTPRSLHPNMVLCSGICSEILYRDAAHPSSLFTDLTQDMHPENISQLLAETGFSTSENERKETPPVPPCVCYKLSDRIRARIMYFYTPLEDVERTFPVITSMRFYESAVSRHTLYNPRRAQESAEARGHGQRSVEESTMDASAGWEEAFAEEEELMAEVGNAQKKRDTRSLVQPLWRKRRSCIEPYISRDVITALMSLKS